MAAHHDLIKRLHDDDELRDAIMAAPTRDAKQQLVRDAGLTVPDHHDVLQHVAGGADEEWDDVSTGAVTGAPAPPQAALLVAGAASAL